jgi:nucleotide-binding universal stress UspA family protein
VIARSHLPDLAEKLFGSVESGVVRHATCPVLVVPGHPG